MEGLRLHAFTVARVASTIAFVWFIFFLPGAWDWQRDLGAALAVTGGIGILIAHAQLGTSFSIKAEAHHLVTRGIYSKIRNPIYVFGMAVIAGFVFVVHRPQLWIIFVIVTLIQIVRARREARVLESAFGDEYRDYRRKTWF
ncbi:MAG: isoprenylcysteine carboxylmethyltransferase family protein [Candidatus Sulfotelmatobacter sp.]|jgi:protein-S-isoprenylcysteine O-methyltransferase Ste14